VGRGIIHPIGGGAGSCTGAALDAYLDVLPAGDSANFIDKRRCFCFGHKILSEEQRIKNGFSLLFPYYLL
jgi:cytochrome c oxidase assembly protein Cox11